MPLNLLKLYPEYLELGHLNEDNRMKSLRGIFLRDIENNPGLNFRTRIIRPIKGEEPAMVILFKHLTSEEIQKTDDNGKIYSARVFELDRSKRLHWIKYHLTEQRKPDMEIFSVNTRDQRKRQNIIRTYIYDKIQKYVIVLDPQRSKMDYYLVTAFYLNQSFGEKKMKKLLKAKLPELY